MKQLLRMFSADAYKGTRNYIDTQKKYELLRTLLFFGLALGLFVTGYVTTGKKENLLTIVAVCGCLPACKSLVNLIMFFRYHSCKKEDSDLIEAHIGQLEGLYDLVFTSYQKNFSLSHAVVHANTICGYTTQSDFPEKEFQAHLEKMLANDGYRGWNIKIFHNLQKYTDRLTQLNALEAEDKNVSGVLQTLRSVTL